MTTRRITPHKGGRTALVPGGRIRPQTLQRIHETMRERGKSWGDLVEEKFSGGNMKFYILQRDNEYMVVSVNGDNDPLYGNGSWNIYAGPFASAEDAENNIP